MANAAGARTTFVKMHGLGNDFILFDFARSGPPPGGDDATRWARAARRLCERHTGVGADGVVLVLPSASADVRMRIFNSDGSEAGMCGNASRCVAIYAHDAGLASGEAVSIEAKGARVRAEIVTGGEFAGQVRVDMGLPSFRSEDIPVAAAGPVVIGERHTLAAGEFEITCVSMGNPHCVIFVPDVAAVELERLGPAIEHDPFFPDRTNVEFVQVDSAGDLTVRVWERGAGPTLACGTGACASLVAAAELGLSGRSARVHLPGGTLFVEWAENGRVFMTGPAKRVFTGVIDNFEEWLR